MTMTEILTGLISAAFMTLGFGLYFNQRISHALTASIVGFLTWAVYLLCMPLTNSIFLLSAIAGQTDVAARYGTDTLLVVLGISTGIVLISVCAKLFVGIWNHFKN